MINLIPNEEKKKMAQNFYFRLAILSFFMLSFSILFATLAMTPAYILAKARENFINQKLDIQKSEPVPVLDQDTQKAIEVLDTKLSLIEKIENNTLIVSKKIINEIIESKVPGIKITRIFYDNSSLTNKPLGIYGTAPSRERLLLFRQSLENNDSFSNVDLPISNFVKGSDIEFYLTLIPSTKNS